MNGSTSALWSAAALGNGGGLGGRRLGLHGVEDAEDGDEAEQGHDDPEAVGGEVEEERVRHGVVLGVVVGAHHLDHAVADRLGERGWRRFNAKEREEEKRRSEISGPERVAKVRRSCALPSRKSSATR